MTYPQPAAAQAIINGQNVYRLSTLLSSPGDIYEIDASSLGVALGPDSDLALLRLNYYDVQVPTSLVNEAIISPDRSFIERADARLDQPYPTSGGKLGRILVSPADLWDPTYVPIGVGGDFRIQRYVPRLDVMSYFQSLPSVIPQRSDGRLAWDFVQGGLIPGGASYIVIPFYGRKYASIDITNWMGAIACTVEIRGVNYTTNSVAQPQETAIQAPVVLAAAGGHLSKQIRAAANGMYDGLLFIYTPASGQSIGPIPTRIITSDDAL